LTTQASLGLVLGIHLQALSLFFDQQSSMTKAELWLTAAFRQDQPLSTTLAPTTLPVELARTLVKMFPRKSIAKWELASMSEMLFQVSNPFHDELSSETMTVL
jgi:hypothetical protein